MCASNIGYWIGFRRIFSTKKKKKKNKRMSKHGYYKTECISSKWHWLLKSLCETITTFIARPLVSIESIISFYTVKYGLPSDGHVFLLRILQLKKKLNLLTATGLVHFNQGYLELKKKKKGTGSNWYWVMASATAGPLSVRSTILRNFYCQHRRECLIPSTSRSSFRSQSH